MDKIYKDLIEKFVPSCNEREEVLPKDLGVRKKTGIFYAKDHLIFVISQKSRVLVKDTEKIEDILKKTEGYLDKIFQEKTVVIDAPLCSKAKKQLESLGWKVKV